MAVQLTNTLNMPREEWLKARRYGIGGSDAAAIAGLNKWKSPITVYLEKIGEIQSEAGEAAYWGIMLEDIIAREFSRQTGLKVQRRNAILQHPEYPFMLANLDRVIIDKKQGRGVLEIKTTSAYNKSAWDDDRVPDEYLIQVQHYLAVTGYQYAYIAVLIGGQQYQHKYIPRDEEIINYLIRIESDFWQMVENRTPPEMDGSQASTDVLNILYPAFGPKSEMILPDEALNLIEEYKAAQAEEKAAKERKEAAENKLKALLGECETGRIGEHKVTWKTVSSSKLDTKKLKAEHPDIYKQYAKTSEYRRFTVK